jgi:hypothetical protein
MLSKKEMFECVENVEEFIEEGYTVKAACKKAGMAPKTYYAHKKELKKEKPTKPSKAAVEPTANHSFKIGENYFIQTVTHYYSGKLLSVTETDVVLKDAAWIANTGRFADAMQAVEKLSEVEPIPGEQIVFRGAMVGATIPAWDSLPKTQK